jgi:hypothetical protein
MAERTKRLLAALDSANCQLARITTVGNAQDKASNLSCICSSVTSVLITEVLEATKASRKFGAQAALLLQSNIVCELTKYLGGILRALGKCTLCSAPIYLQALWDMALDYLHELVKDGDKALWRPWLTQVLDGGTDT